VIDKNLFDLQLKFILPDPDFVFQRFFNNRKILSHSHFESINWIFIYQMLHDLPRLFSSMGGKAGPWNSGNNEIFGAQR
jgi:hypothetical protein